ncbi:MAG TPA: NfeD family protein [Acidimicrobiales bacterium]|nr:NfeD family protein [Acidimicrobiales bacterium]
MVIAALLVGTVSAVGVLAPGWLPWIVGAGVGAATVTLVLAGIHAGGHGWFVPIPAAALGAVWALVASAGHWDSAPAWSLAALCLLCAVVGTVLVVPAIAYRHAPPMTTGTRGLVGAEGTAVTDFVPSGTDLAPTGIAKVNNETWTAQSLSGPLPAGTPVHVARVDGLHLLVWSELGTVPASPHDLGAAGNAEPRNSSRSYNAQKEEGA